jgi:chromosome segregation ATPase
MGIGTITVLLYADSLIKQLKGSVNEYQASLICIDSRLQCMEQELKLKDDVCISLKENLASAESEKNNLEVRNQGCSLEIAKLCKDNKDLNDLLSSFVAKVTELDKEHASMSSHVSQLLSSFERFQGMVQEEKMLIARSSKDKFEDLHNQYVELMSENNALKIQIEELKSRIIELQKTQEIVMAQHVEECQVAEDKIRRLESEADISASNISRLEKLASELQGRIQQLLEDSALAQNNKVCRRPGLVMNHYYLNNHIL